MQSPLTSPNPFKHFSQVSLLPSTVHYAQLSDEHCSQAPVSVLNQYPSLHLEHEIESVHSSQLSIHPIQALLSGLNETPSGHLQSSSALSISHLHESVSLS